MLPSNPQSMTKLKKPPISIFSRFASSGELGLCELSGMSFSFAVHVSFIRITVLLKSAFIMGFISNLLRTQCCIQLKNIFDFIFLIDLYDGGVTSIFISYAEMYETTSCKILVRIHRRREMKPRELDVNIFVAYA